MYFFSQFDLIDNWTVSLPSSTTRIMIYETTTQASSNLNPYHQMASAQMAAAAAAAAYGSYPHPLTLIPSLMSAADQLTNHYHGVMPTAAPAVSALIKTPAQRTDRLEVSTVVCIAFSYVLQGFLSCNFLFLVFNGLSVLLMTWSLFVCPLTSSWSSNFDQICREYLRGNCKRPDSDCRFAHPPDHIQVDPGDGLVTVCMDFLKGRCSRDSCRYLHPPAHLQAQLKSRTSNSVVASASTEPGSAVSFATPASSLLPNLLPQHLANNRSPFRLWAKRREETKKNEPRVQYKTSHPSSSLHHYIVIQTRETRKEWQWL